MSDLPATSASVWERIRFQLASLQSQSDTRQANSAAVAEKLARRAQVFRERVHNPQSAGPVLPTLFFSANRSRYGLPLNSVIEILSLDSFSSVPGAPDYIHGVVHFRGAILSLINLGRLFGAPESGITDIHFYIVAQGGGQKVAIAAGDVEDLLDVPGNQIRPAPEWSGRTPRHWVKGVFQQDRLLLQLDEILQEDAIVNWRTRGS
ncbi:chemotaxis protein CheW [Planctomicrobium sp. SH661]|uniref:chemotaxis protein CheW n=1 Tax=Planctomicrobium sp. SH661 TaxID=3448124 RepID=UPI003F5C20ED